MSFALTALLAVSVAFFMDRMCEGRGLLPPGFLDPWRRILAWTLVAMILWVGAFGSLASIGQETPELDLSQLTTPRLFLLHFLLVMTIVSWFLLGFAGVRPAPPPPPPPPDYPLSDEEPAPVAAPAAPPVPLFRQFMAQFGFIAPDVPREIGVGVLVGIGSWGAVLAVAILLGLIIMALGGEDALPKQPPALIPWIVALPVGVRLLISLSAGVVEEVFFRGFLQPRIGIFLSTLLFILAHFSYGQPFMLVGIGTLSLIYAFLVRWRQNIWPAIAAHFLFDAVQLLFIIPFALKYMEKAGTGN
ncbi:MAG TPA: CPBP family intramembrane glutamic endopeptidase [Thermoanaerobaculia bacterium]|nr:CPBP family intramembrane glutamic endopeptidase [Thermoanaerobaculia bacterium]